VVTEFIEGERIIGPVSAALSQEERNELAQSVTAAFGHQILVDGVFQADPHPGNLLLMPDGRVALLDFGLTKELPDDIRIGFAHLVVAAGERSPLKVAEAFEMLGVRAKSSDPQDLLMLTRLFFDPRDAATRTEFNQQRNEALARSPVEAIPGDLVLLGRVVGLLRGVCSSLGVPLSPMAMLRPYAERALVAEKQKAPGEPGNEAAS
jgi:aarF domain-containing kinase